MNLNQLSSIYNSVLRNPNLAHTFDVFSKETILPKDWEVQGTLRFDSATDCLIYEVNYFYKNIPAVVYSEEYDMDCGFLFMVDDILTLDNVLLSEEIIEENVDFYNHCVNQLGL